MSASNKVELGGFPSVPTAQDGHLKVYVANADCFVARNGPPAVKDPDFCNPLVQGVATTLLSAGSRVVLDRDEPHDCTINVSAERDSSSTQEDALKTLFFGHGHTEWHTSGFVRASMKCGEVSFEPCDYGFAGDAYPDPSDLVPHLVKCLVARFHDQSEAQKVASRP